MKGISIYMALIILFNVNLRSVCVSGDGDKTNQNTGHSATQKSCNEEKEVPHQQEENMPEYEEKTQKQKEAKDLPDDENCEKKTKSSDEKHSTMSSERVIAQNSYMKKCNSYSSGYLFLSGGYDIMMVDAFNSYGFYYEGDIDENSKQGGCCEIL